MSEEGKITPPEKTMCDECSLQSENERLREQLEKAVECVKFYANPKNWDAGRPERLKTEDGSGSLGDWVSGRRARDFILHMGLGSEFIRSIEGDK